MFLFLLLSLLHRASTTPINPNELNLEFESVIDVYPNNSNNTFMKFINSALDVICQLFTNAQVTPRKNDTLHQFLHDLKGIFEKYTREDLKFVADAIESELEGYDQEEYANNPFINNPKVRLYLKDTLIRDLGADKEKKVMKLKLPAKSNLTTMDTEFLGMLAELFGTEDLGKFKNFLKSFNEYPVHMNKFKLYSAVKNVLDFSFVKKINELDPDARSKLNKKISELFKKEFEEDEKGQTVVYKNIDVDYIEFRNNMKINSKSITNDIVTKETVKIKSRKKVDDEKVLQTTAVYRPLPSCGLTTNVVKTSGSLVASNVELFVKSTA